MLENCVSSLDLQNHPRSIVRDDCELRDLVSNGIGEVKFSILDNLECPCEDGVIIESEN